MALIDSDYTYEASLTSMAAIALAYASSREARA